MIQVPLDTPVDEVDAVVLVAGDDVLVVACEPGRDIAAARRGVVAAGEVRVRQWRNSGPFPRHRGRTVPTYATLASLGVAQELITERAFRIDGVRWRGLLAPVLLSYEWVDEVAARRGRRPVAEREMERGTSLADFLAALPPRPDPRRENQERVAEVRAVYGRMLADVAYRIENAALFDSAVETTRQFETALAMWSDVAPTTPDDEVRRRAAMVALTFDTARAHAETVGLAHLPQQARDRARRAAGAARLARAATTDAEQAAAQDQVVRILRSLALYYLPDPDRLPRAIAP
ncbi:MAG: hypothetical protein KDB41_10210 [Propionibacteriaceae bacterium]|nr:hypothetical protein [Propionibacteriaceae bacterium]